MDVEVALKAAASFNWDGKAHAPRPRPNGPADLTAWQAGLCVRYVSSPAVTLDAGRTFPCALCQLDGPQATTRQGNRELE